MLQILHISDLHLFIPGSLHDDFVQLKKNQGFPYRQLAQLYTFAWTPAQNALADALHKVAGDQPALLILTGDIGALPYATAPDVEACFYSYVRSLIDVLAPSSEILIILGNHDWTDGQTTPFSTTSFDTVHQVRGGSRTAYFSQGVSKAIIYLVDSTNAILPATGEVSQASLNYLRDHFRDGHNGAFVLRDQSLVSQDSYDQAIKVLVLHHYALPSTAYWGRLRWWEHLELRLRNRPGLMRVCRNEIDILLFGHSHCPTFQARGGPIMIDAGSTLGTITVASPPDAQFQRILVQDPRTVQVEGYVWDGIKSDFVNCSRMPFRRNKTGVWSEAS